MGFLRFLLAAAVIAEHSTSFFGLSFTGGHLAVRLFFIISGFYMMLILSTKYTTAQPKRYRLFISNRFLRIYPTYFFIFFLSLLFYLAASAYLHRPADRLVLWQDAWKHGHSLWLMFMGLCQFTIIGMDTVCLFVYDLVHGIHLPAADSAPASVGWLPTAGADPAGIVPAWRFLFVPQSWSISIELLFYLIVPWLTSWRTRNLILLGSLSIASLLVAKYLVNPALFGLLGYFFFPFHVVLFVLGMLAYRHSEAYLNWIPHGLKIALISAMFSTLLLAQFIPTMVRTFLCITLVFLSLPILFEWTKSSRLQKWVGDLSYPMYICHILVKWVLLALAGISVKGATPAGWLLLICSVAMAAMILWLIDYPVDKWRQRRFKRNSTHQTLEPELLESKTV
jgi:peptidoglycan/LPS O-acetylase OafA/YrhL